MKRKGMDAKTVSRWLKLRALELEFQEYLADLLQRMCAVDSTPSSELKRTRQQEEACYNMLRESIQSFGPSGVFSRHPISPEIRRHPAYTFPYYAGTHDAYAGRGNLIFLWESSGSVKRGQRIAINAHIDTVTPFFAPRREGGCLYGRGTSDDKGGCVAMAGALRLLEEARRLFGKAPGNDLLFFFVTDEETGGNGSLSLVLDRSLKERYDAVLVLECCDGEVYPANRGALWYRVEFPAAGPPDLSLAFAAIRELEKEGEDIRDESVHPLFPDRPVQSNPGILGPYGEWPSRICGLVELVLRCGAPGERLRQQLQAGLAAYTASYGDKSGVRDPAAGKLKVERHFDLEPLPGGKQPGWLLRVHGCTGHMGSIRENDSALIKAAFLVEAAEKGEPELKLSFPKPAASPLVLEGGQGFLPTHSISQVKERLTAAVSRAHQSHGRGNAGAAPRVSFDKLHNEAYEGDPHGPLLQTALKSAAMIYDRAAPPVRGWPVSCDARLFAREYPGMEVLTLGAGKIAYAHSDEERIDLQDLARGAAHLALTLLLQGEL